MVETYALEICVDTYQESDLDARKLKAIENALIKGWKLESEISRTQVAENKKTGTKAQWKAVVVFKRPVLKTPQ